MKKESAIIRAIEVVVALVMVLVLYGILSAGTLGSIGRSATGWYSQKMDGLFTISVVDTSVRLPHLDRASLPIASPPESAGTPEASTPPESSTPPEAPTRLEATETSETLSDA